MLGVVAAGLAALLAIGVVLWASKGTDADNVVSVRAVEDSEHRVIYLEEYSVFVVATDGGPIALMDDAQHAGGDRVRYCPSSGRFEGPRFGARFDRLGRYAAGPAQTDLDRVVVEISDGEIIVHVGEVRAATGRSLSADAPKGPACESFADDPGFFLPGGVDGEAQQDLADRWVWATEDATTMPNGVVGVTRTGPEPRFDYAHLGEEQRFLAASQAPASPPRDLLSEQPLEPVLHVGTLETTGSRVFIYRQQQPDGTMMFCTATARHNGTSTSCTADVRPGLEWSGGTDGDTLQIVFDSLPDNTSVVTISNGDASAWTQRPIAGIAIFEIPTQAHPNQVSTAVALDAGGQTIVTEQLVLGFVE